MNHEKKTHAPMTRGESTKRAPLAFRGEPQHGREGLARRPRNGHPINLRETPSPSYAVFMEPPGKVPLEKLTDPDWRTQLKALLRTYGRTGSSDFSRKVSEETLRNRTDILFSSIGMLRDDRRLETLSQIKPRHLPRLFELWTARGISKRSQINYFNVMRWFWKLFGLQIDPIATFETTPGEFTINRAAEADRSWTGNGVSFDEVLARVREIDPVAARLFQAMKTYGLRAKESLRLNPHEADAGNVMHVTKGSKTGRPRAIVFGHFDEEEFRRTLDSLKAEVPEDAHLAWSNRTLKQAKRRLLYVARQAGVSKNGLGITMHGLRHEWAIDQLQSLAGVVAPVRGGTPLDYRKLSGVRRLISRALGHNRIKITSAYYGSFATLEREQAKRFQASWERIAIVLEKVGDVLRHEGIDNLFMIGARALGGNRSPLEPYEFALPEGVDPVTALRVAPQVAELVMGATGLDCTVQPIEALPSNKRLLWNVEAVPLYNLTAPTADYDPSAVQRDFREAVKRFDQMTGDGKRGDNMH